MEEKTYYEHPEIRETKKKPYLVDSLKSHSAGLIWVLNSFWTDEIHTIKTKFKIYLKKKIVLIT